MSAPAGSPRTASQRATSLRELAWHGGGFAGALLRALLLPAEGAFRAASGAYHAAYDRGLLPALHVAVPVISVGNLTVGGSGKTPVVRWLVARLLGMGRAPAVLHGGYAADEPELHRRWHPGVPVHAGRDRLASAGLAIARGADVLVLDDAFQHRRLARDLDLLLVTAEQGIHPARLLPRGPWREPPSAGARADLLVVTRRTAGAGRAATVAADAARATGGVPVARVALRPEGWRRWAAGSPAHPGTAAPAPDAAPKGDVLAVAAIAGPAHFVANARAAGAVVADAMTFADHHGYTPADAARIRERAAGRPVVTTEKDAVKLERWADELELWVLDQEVVVEEGMDHIDAALARALA